MAGQIFITFHVVLERPSRMYAFLPPYTSIEATTVRGRCQLLSGRPALQRSFLYVQTALLVNFPGLLGAWLGGSVWWPGARLGGLL